MHLRDTSTPRAALPRIVTGLALAALAGVAAPSAAIAEPTQPARYIVVFTVSAPGGNGSTCDDQILSTLPGNAYGCLQGTSMASPHAAGVAALYVSRFGTVRDGDMQLNGISVDRALKRTAIDIGVRGNDLCYGRGRVAALRAVLSRQGDAFRAEGCSDYYD